MVYDPKHRHSVYAGIGENETISGNWDFTGDPTIDTGSTWTVDDDHDGLLFGSRSSNGSHVLANWDLGNFNCRVIFWRFSSTALEMWLTINAYPSSATQWTADNASYPSSGWKLAGTLCGHYYRAAGAGAWNYDGSAPSWTSWFYHYAASATQSGLWVGGGTLHDEGVVSLGDKNVGTLASTLYGSTAVTYHVYNSSAPAAITRTLEASSGWTTVPSADNFTSRGCRIYGTSDSVAAGITAYWHGRWAT